jgi:hypothetical protein
MIVQKALSYDSSIRVGVRRFVPCEEVRQVGERFEKGIRNSDLPDRYPLAPAHESNEEVPSCCGLDIKILKRLQEKIVHFERLQLLYGTHLE